MWQAHVKTTAGRGQNFVYCYKMRAKHGGSA